MVKRKLEGSITVETVFVFPIVLFIVMALLYMAFYMHDKLVVESIIDKAGEKFNQAIRQPTDYATGSIYYDQITERSVLCRYNGDYSVEINYMENYIQQELGKRLMLSEVKEIQVEKEMESFIITVNTKSRISLAPALVYLKDVKNTEYEREESVFNSAEYVRAASVSLDTLSQIKGFDKIISVVDKIKELIN